MSHNPEELSERELEILRLVATGASNKVIASQLYISANTVKVHLRNIFTKIGASSRTEAAMYAVNQGLVPGAAEGAEDQTGSSIAEPALVEDMPPKSGRGARGFSWSVIILVIVLLLSVAAIAAFTLSRQSTVLQTRTVADPTLVASPWQLEEPMPSARFGLAAVVYQEQIYAIGGETAAGVTASMDRYDPISNSWHEQSPKQTPVADVNAAVLEGKIYLPGGRLSSGQVTDVLEIYDPRLDDWSQGARLPAPRSAYALVSFEGRLYLFGGWDGRAFVSDAYVYNPRDESWQELPPLETPRGFAGAAISGRQIVVAGGYDGKKALSRVDIFQPDLVGSTEPAWKKAADLPGGRYAMGMTSVADFVYLVGGNGKFEANTSTLVFSPQINQWQSFQPPPSSVGAHIAVVSLGSYLYSLGGVERRVPLDTNYSYKAIYTIVLPIIP
jgi:DNA-binding CsgD family transcriptional regulator/N-acetylneuraminic acid mutarotase